MQLSLHENILKGVKKEITEKQCPICKFHEKKGLLVRMKSKFGKGDYYYCSTFPKCKYRDTGDRINVEYRA